MSTAIIEHHEPKPVLLRNISWQTYECLLKDYADCSSPRIAYNEGTLEIMSPLPAHERGNRLIAQIVEILLEEWEMEYDNLGSTTFKNEDTQKGVEPDTCFYIKNVAQIAGKERIDLTSGDPAPDLVIEMDVTSLSLDKMPILASFAVPEVWRFFNEAIMIYVLNEDHFERRSLRRSSAECVAPEVDRCYSERSSGTEPDTITLEVDRDGTRMGATEQAFLIYRAHFS